MSIITVFLQFLQLQLKKSVIASLAFEILVVTLLYGTVEVFSIYIKSWKGFFYARPMKPNLIARFGKGGFAFGVTSDPFLCIWRLRAFPPSLGSRNTWNFLHLVWCSESCITPTYGLRKLRPKSAKLGPIGFSKNTEHICHMPLNMISCRLNNLTITFTQ